MDGLFLYEGGKAGVTGTYEKFSIEDSEMVYNMVNSVSRAYYDNPMLLNIISEESGSYFSGDKSLEQVIDSMKKRLELYYLE